MDPNARLRVLTGSLILTMFFLVTPNPLPMSRQAQEVSRPVLPGHSAKTVSAQSARNPLTEVPAETTGPSSFSFATVGDYDNNTRTMANWRSLSTSGASFVLALGDFLYKIPVPNGGISNEQAWCRDFKGNITDVEIVAGNHETFESNITSRGGGGSITKFALYCPFTLGSSYGSGSVSYGFQYYFDYPSTSPLARFIMVDPDIWLANSTSSAAHYGNGSPYQRWVGSQIDAARSLGIPWVIVGMHKDCITTGGSGCEIGQDFMRFLISKHVDLVLQGHDHNYQRSKELACATQDTYVPSCVVNDGSAGIYPRGLGTIFLIDGTGGASLQPINATRPEFPYFAKTNSTTWGYTKFTVSSARIQAQFVPTTKSFADSWAIQDSPPVVNFSESATSVLTGAPISFNATASDPDGTVVSYAWNFGDSATGSGALTTHSYAKAGTYTVTLTVTDNSGLTATTISVKTILDRPPVAKFTEPVTTALTAVSISLDASTSTDPDGTVVSYAWNFGDANTATGVTTSHSYATAGSYTVTLTETDDSGSTGITTAVKTIADRPPVANFTYSPKVPNVGQVVVFNGTSSADPDGSIVSYAWDLGDGSRGTGAITTYAYGRVGNFTVVLSVTDNSGTVWRMNSTLTVIDSTPPFWPLGSNLTTGNIRARNMILYWTPAEDNVGVVAYKLYSNGSIVATLGNVTTYSVTGLVPYTTYVFHVEACDAAGNCSTSGSNGGPSVTAFTYLPGDVNNDCKVDISDLTLVGASFGKSNGTPGFNPAADLNHDGTVDITDLSIVGANFGEAC